MLKFRPHIELYDRYSREEIDSVVSALHAHKHEKPVNAVNPVAEIIGGIIFFALLAGCVFLGMAL